MVRQGFIVLREGGTSRSYLCDKSALSINANEKPYFEGLLVKS